MTNDSIREFCMALPMTTEEVQWEEHLLFKIGGKMFCHHPARRPSLQLQIHP